MALSLWLGLFVVTRSPRSLISWLAGFTLWSGSLYFAGRVAYLHATTAEMSRLTLMVLNLGASLLPAPWLHLSTLLLPERVGGKFRRYVTAAYLLALVFILSGSLSDAVIYPLPDGFRVYSSGKGAGWLYPFFALFVIVTLLLSLFLLYRLWRHERRRHLKSQLATLAWATALTIPSGLYLSLGTWFRLNTPTLVGDMLLAVSVILLGYAVAKWNALVEGRVIELDFLYTLLIIGLVAGVYFLMTPLLFGAQGLSIINALVLVALAILSHFTYDGVRTFLDRLFYQRQFQELRANLRSFAREAGTGRSLESNLGIVLHSFCRSFSTPRGFIALRARIGIEVQGAGSSALLLHEEDWPALETFQVRILTTPERTGNLAGIEVLVPLLMRGEQIGVLALGEKVPTASYLREEQELLDDLGDQLAAVIATALLQENSLREIDQLVSEYRQREREVQLGVQALLAPEEVDFPVPAGMGKEDFAELVEQALRYCHDVSYLGQHPLANLGVVRDSLAHADGPITHLDRGRVLREVLLAAVDKLRPNHKPPSPPSREWYPYLVVHDAYVLGESNREIMARLYISEGTFNRTRRRAILAVARALAEMERRS